jgi:hypothetical protein
MNFRQKLSLASMFGVLAIPLFIMGPNGKPVMSVDDWVPDMSGVERVINTAKNVAQNGDLASAGGIQAIGESITATAAPEKPKKLYKWKDKNGVWQFSNTPPPADVKNAYEQDLPKMNNVMQAVKVRTEEPRREGPSRDVSMPFPTTIPLQDIPKLIDDARNVQKLADDRQRALDKI